MSRERGESSWVACKKCDWTGHEEAVYGHILRDHLDYDEWFSHIEEREVAR